MAADKNNETVSKVNEKEIEKIIADGIENHYQVVFTGAPGTGKTYSVRKYVKEHCEHDETRYKFVQFHPSYDYSDFVEGLRPVTLVEDGAPAFVRVDGIFKEFCRQIVEKNLDEAIKARLEDLSQEKEEKEKEIKEASDPDRAVLENQLEEIKENLAAEQFLKSENENERAELKSRILEQLYEYTIHHLKDASGGGGTESRDRATDLFNQGSEDYYFIIDEINRADLSRVFGELMFGLEETYRGIENRFATQYKNLKTYEIDKETGVAEPMKFDCFEKGFFIPRNLRIIGTMNDIDRSVESFDFALRRRFCWIDIRANDIMQSSLTSMLLPEIKKSLENRHSQEEADAENGSITENPEQKAREKIEDLSDKIREMNNTLRDDKYPFGLSEAYYLGPAYFRDYKYEYDPGKDNPEKGSDNLEEIFRLKIEPIIREYTRGRKSEDVEDLINACKAKLELPNS